MSLGITPSHDRTLDEVKDAGRARWRDDEIASRLQGQGGRHSRQAQGRRGARRTLRPTSRRSRSKPRPASSAAGAAGAIPAEDGRSGVPAPPRTPPAAPKATTPTQRVVFRVTDINDAAARCQLADAKTARRDACSSAIGDDVIGQYIALARKRSRHQPINQAGAGAGHGGSNSGSNLPDSTECRSSLRRTAFAARYAAGEPQVVWTTLVADLETPVSAFLKARRRPADELPARSRRGRRSARPLFHHRPRARSDLARRDGKRRDQPRARAPIPTRSCRCRRAAARRAARADRRKPHGACRTACRRWRPACSAISATTWCG